MLAERFPLQVSAGSATAWTEGDRLHVSTGELERTWRWTGAGLTTVGLRHVAAGREWAGSAPEAWADWSLPGCAAGGAATHEGGTCRPNCNPAVHAHLISLVAVADDDEGFTAGHLRVTAEVHYPEASTTVKLVIWAYPDAPGLRTQLWVKGRPCAPCTPGNAATTRVDLVPVSPDGLRCVGIGYYNDAQHRNAPETPLLRRETVGFGETDWASVFCVEDEYGGFAMVKESHKCVNQPGVNTGRFVFDARGLANTGWGLSPSDLVEGEYQWCWASWVVAYSGGEAERQLALKRFDRLRFPSRPERDMWTVVCTWGECDSARDGCNYAAQPAVLEEMHLTSAMGIDMLLIDCGWQLDPQSNSLFPDEGEGWRPHPATHPGGWSAILKCKRELGIRLGLWGAAHRISLDDMVWNWRELEMEQFKIDFAMLRDYPSLSRLALQARQFMLQTGQRCIISWDTTEKAPRVGYFWAREYGNVHFINRKPRRPSSVVYVPWLTLRDFWHLAHYQNLNKWQLTIQNPEVVDRDLSDAHLYSPEYCVATALMGTPLFMALPRHYSPRSRERIGRLLEIYGQHRRRMWDGIVFPLGDQPSNASWSGFHARCASGEGYLTVFRERLNRDDVGQVVLQGVRAGMPIRITDLLGDRTWTTVAAAGGAIRLEIQEPGGFLFLRYEDHIQ